MSFLSALCIYAPIKLYIMIGSRLKTVRKWLKSEGYNAIVIPTNDPHFSEYVAEYWKVRCWVSGFTGSAGTVVITDKEALLWCDSRYFVQAEIELSETPFTAIQKIGIEGTPSVSQWLNCNISAGGKVAIDGKLVTINGYREMETNAPNISIAAINDPFDALWENRPELPKSILKILDDSVTGESINSKISRVIECSKLDDMIYITSALDEIAWLFNIRGADVNYNPVVISYAIIASGEATFFVDRVKITEDSLSHLNEQGVKVLSYSQFDDYLKSLNGRKVMVNYSKFDIYHYNRLSNEGAIVCDDNVRVGAITYLKSLKNKTEQRGICGAMINDGVALVKFNMWLEQAMDSDNEITEYEIAQKLREFRMSSPNFVGESFSPIVGYGPNGAIVHYSPPKEDSAVIGHNSFLLFDSGGQYQYGTTDITRTIHMSIPTERERNDYTLVLKGNISLSMAVFPVGTTGYQLDILARQHLLRNSLNYGHGTGHGIGHYLNVHEGPHSIRADYNPMVLESGMVVSNEPGLYRVGKYGIRLENIIKVAEHSKSEFGEFLCFQVLTLYPFDIKSINVGMLTIEERHWLNRYHAYVFDKLSQYLTTEERFWLSNKTKAI